MECGQASANGLVRQVCLTSMNVQEKRKGKKELFELMISKTRTRL